jgi:hypothetical protein
MSRLVMRISLDIDDALVCRAANAPRERSLLPGFIHVHFSEPLRQGTRSLFRALRRRGFSVWIYTTSLRSPLHIRLWMMLHGLRVDGIVNEERHRIEMAGRKFSRVPSKYPPAFGIDLHVDDSEGVRIEGEELGFNVVVVRPEDDLWTTTVLDAANQLLSGSRDRHMKSTTPG